MTDEQVNEKLEQAEDIVRNHAEDPRAQERIYALRDECPAEFASLFNSLTEALIAQRGE